MTRRSRTRGIAALLLGVVVTLVVVELVLRLVGAVFLWQRDEGSATGAGDAITILSLGESQTVLFGDDAYPRQLERVLNERVGAPRFRVVNRALTGISSSTIIRNLETDLEETNPAIVMVMMGINDRIRFYGFDSGGTETHEGSFFDRLKTVRLVKFLLLDVKRERLQEQREEAAERRVAELAAQEEAQDPSTRRSPAFLRSAIAIYREHGLPEQERRTWMELAQRFPSADVLGELAFLHLTQGNAAEAERVAREIIHTYPRRGAGYSMLAKVLVGRGRKDEAERVLRDRVAVNPKSRSARLELADFLLGNARLAEAETLYLEAMPKEEQARVRVWVQLARLRQTEGKHREATELLRQAASACGCGIVWDELGLHYQTLGDLKAAEEAYREAIRLGPKRWAGPQDRKWRRFQPTQATAHLARLYERQGRKDEALRLLEEISPDRKTLTNYRTLVRTVRQGGAKVVAVQYPMRSVAELKAMLPSDPGVIAVDNEELFRTAVRRLGYRKIFFDSYAGDFGHCTAKGNRILAEHIATTMLRAFYPDLARRSAGRAVSPTSHPASPASRPGAPASAAAPMAPPSPASRPQP